jgi:hypothetical protein
MGLLRFLLLIGVTCSELHALRISVPKTHPERTLSLNSGYWTRLSDMSISNNNRALSNFYDELGMVYGFWFDELSEGPWCRKHRGWFSLFHLVPHSVLVSVQGVGYHEFGHFSRDRAFGYDPYFVNKRKPGVENGFKNPFEYTLYLFTRPFCWEATARGQRLWLSVNTLDGVDDTTRQALENAFDTGGMANVNAYVNANSGNKGVQVFQQNILDENIIISAAGVNNAMRFSGDLTDRVYQGKGHVSDFGTYMLARLQTCFYPSEGGANASNDMDALIQGYKAKNIAVRKNNLNLAAQLSFFCSASTYAYLVGWSRFLRRGYTTVRPLTFRGVRFPDVETYFLAQGVSYKIITGYRVDRRLDFPMSIEFVGKGQKGVEGSIGARLRFPNADNLEISGYVLFGQEIGAGAKVRIPFEDRFFIEGATETMHFKSFYGQRNVPTLKESLRSNSFMVRAGLMY